MGMRVLRTRWRITEQLALNSENGISFKGFSSFYACTMIIGFWQIYISEVLPTGYLSGWKPSSLLA
jgi:hypothetical protein